MQAFYAKMGERAEQGDRRWGINPNEWIFFFSIKLKDTTLQLEERYDLKSPWCYPVKISHIMDLHSFQRPFREGIEGSEVPKFELFKDIDEYKIPEERT
jgi:hypothetical protein